MEGKEIKARQECLMYHLSFFGGWRTTHSKYSRRRCNVHRSGQLLNSRLKGSSSFGHLFHLKNPYGYLFFIYELFVPFPYVSEEMFLLVVRTIFYLISFWYLHQSIMISEFLSRHRVDTDASMHIYLSIHISEWSDTVSTYVPPLIIWWMDFQWRGLRRGIVFHDWHNNVWMIT